MITNTSNLHSAVINNDLDLIKKLVWEGQDACGRNTTGTTPLHEACYAGHFEIVKYLIEEAGARSSISVKNDNHGHTALNYAAMRGHVEIAKYLVENVGAKTDVREKNKYGCTPLHEACYAGHLELVKLIIEDWEGSDIVNWKTDNHGHTPLQYACIKCHMDIVKYLIDKGGANPTVQEKNVYGNTPLHEACYAGGKEVVQYLIEEAGARDIVNWKTNEHKHTPLQYACINGHLEVVQYMIESGNAGHTLFEKNNFGNTPFHEACYGGYLELVEYLVTNGRAADIVNETNNYGVTPLHMAAVQGHLDVVRYLCEKASADAERKNHNNATPMDIARTKERWGVIEFLSDHLERQRMSKRFKEMNIDGKEMVQPAVPAFDSLPEAMTCIICLTRPKTATFVHGTTGHFSACFECAMTVQKNTQCCPVCRMKIDMVIRQFNA